LRRPLADNLSVPRSVEGGALPGYAVDLVELLKRMADDVHQILKGAAPGDIPIYQAAKSELLINLKRMKSLCPNASGLTGACRRGDRMTSCRAPLEERTGS
jgi:hypothetical protein